MIERLAEIIKILKVPNNNKTKNIIYYIKKKYTIKLEVMEDQTQIRERPCNHVQFAKWC